MSEKLPASWVWSELQDITEIGPKFNADDMRDTELVHFVPMAAVAENFGGADVSQLRPLNEVRKGYTFFAEGDVLFAKITPCMENGKGALVPHLDRNHAFGSTEFHVLRPSKAISGKWLAYFVSQPSFRKTARHNMTGTAGQLRVPTKWLQAVRMPVPPWAEQSRIVAKLEELLSDLDAGVAELKAAQKKLRQYRQSLLKAAVEGALTASWREAQCAATTPLETGAQLLERILRERRARWEEKQLAKFKEQGKNPPKDWQKKYPEPVAANTPDPLELPEGWVWASLDQLIAESSYGTSVKCNYDGSGTPVLRIPNVSGGKLDLRDIKFSMIELGVGELGYLAVGDVLVIRTNGSIGLVGRAAAVTTSLPVSHYFASYLLRLRCVETTYVHRWIVSVLSAGAGRDWLEARAVSSAGQHNISLSTLLTMSIPLPPLREQARVLNAIENGEETIERFSKALKVSLKQSVAQRQNILSAALAGQLVPQDPNDEPASVLLERIRAERAGQAATKKPRGRKTEKAAA